MPDSLTFPSFAPCLPVPQLYTGHAEYYDDFGYLMWMDASRTRFMMLEHFEEKFCSASTLVLLPRKNAHNLPFSSFSKLHMHR